MDQLELMVSSALFTLIWIIQILHYPSFKFIDKKIFAEFEAFHSNRISLIVIPLMLTECVLLALNFRFIIFLIVLLIWFSTFFIQVPCHNKLKNGHDLAVISRLISTNWIRTILWSIKLFILVSSMEWQIG